MSEKYPIEESPLYKEYPSWLIPTIITVAILFMVFMVFRIAITTQGFIFTVAFFALAVFILPLGMSVPNIFVFRAFYPYNQPYLLQKHGSIAFYLRQSFIDMRRIWLYIPTLFYMALTLFCMGALIVYDFTGLYVDLYPHSILNIFPDIWEHSGGTLDNETYRMVSSLYLINYYGYIYICLPLYVCQALVCVYFFKGKESPRQFESDYKYWLYSIVILIMISLGIIFPFNESENPNGTIFDRMKIWLPYGHYQAIKNLLHFQTVIIFSTALILFFVNFIRGKKYGHYDKIRTDK